MSLTVEDLRHLKGVLDKHAPQPCGLFGQYRGFTIYRAPWLLYGPRMRCLLDSYGLRR